MNRRLLAFTLLALLMTATIDSSAEDFTAEPDASQFLPNPDPEPRPEPAPTATPVPIPESDSPPPPPPPPPVPSRGGTDRDVRQPPPARTWPDSGGRRGETPRTPWPRERVPSDRGGWPGFPGAGTMSALCNSQYTGRFTKHGDRAGLRISGSQMVLYANRSAFSGRGQCVRNGEARASFRFALDDNRNYVFRGTISVNRDGSATLRADQLKFGKVIDHLIMSR